MDSIGDGLANQIWYDGVVPAGAVPRSGSGGNRLLSTCGKVLIVSRLGSDEQTEGMDPGPPSDIGPMPDRIARYRILGLLGKGGFGAVYRAMDETLHREVAIKVPRRKMASDSDQREQWISEAQVVAGLDHPHIVPLYDVGSTDEYPFFVVCKLISGSDLRTQVQACQPSSLEAVSWIASMADALGYAHRCGLVHRDVKPSNILVDDSRHVWLTDFGLALREADLGKGPANTYIGTFHYMSPEQARGEGHLVDGRSDIFGLGIVLYELLSGTRPFPGESSRQLLTNIIRAEPRPLRARAPELPRELERICLKALAKRVSDRYSTATDMADDLRRFADRSSNAGKIVLRPDSTSSSIADETVVRTTDSTQSPTARVIPKGLRSFDEHDHAFFLNLVPGPQDASGTPEIIRRWKTSIESDKIDETFRVGLIYGASGSGKSSLVRAGLIPRLNRSIQVAYVESTSKDTESRLQRALARIGAEPEESIVTSMTRLRQSGSPVRKVLIVLDQFEQWLHAHRELNDNVLVNALRQCDGVHVQCVVLIRDDFWMDATRFFHELDIRLVEGLNSSPVDRFDLRHARFVLAEFGRAYGCLPRDPREQSDAQTKFVDDVVQSVQQDGKVISIHLALLAQMLKGRQWIPETLLQIGGADGIGISFLEATFSSDTAAPLHRSLQKPARAVLGALLPDAGTNIKGRMRSGNELRQVAQLSEPAFDELIGVLDSQLRLITPTAGPEHVDADPSSDKERSADRETVRYYQLTHDFLVPSLRSWLTHKQRETAGGRAQLRMQELSQLWRQRPEARYLPGILEYSRMMILCNANTRSQDETKMMAAATRHHASRWGVAAALMFVAFLGAMLIRDRLGVQAEQREAALLVNQLVAARAAEVPETLAKLNPFSGVARPELGQVLARDDATESEQLRAHLALLPSDSAAQTPSRLQSLVSLSPAISDDELALLANQLGPYADAVKTALWKQLDSDTVDELGFLRTAYLLAQVDPDHDRWDKISDRLAEAIVNQNSIRQSKLAAGFVPISNSLVDPLANVFADDSSSFPQRVGAAITLAQCCGQRDTLLCELVATALPEQMEILFPLVRQRQESLLPLLRKQLQQRAAVTWPVDSPGAQQEFQIEPVVREQLESAAGQITATFAICQSLPFSEFDTLAAVLQESGYRPTCVRPYRHEDQILVASVWKRDGRPWRFVRYDNSWEIPVDASAMRELGLFPADVTVIPSDADNDSATVYGVLWTGIDPQVIDAKIYVDVAESDHSSAWGPLNDEGFTPKSNLKVHAFDGTAHYSSVRQKLRINPRYWDAWDVSEFDYKAGFRKGWLQADVRMSGPPESDPVFATSWWNGGPLESKSVDRSDLDEHRTRFSRLAEEGFRPASISAISCLDGLQATSVWHRPLITQTERDRIASRQANALIALFRLGHTDALWPHLEHRADDRLRAFLINRIAFMSVDPGALIEPMLGNRFSVSQRIAIIAALSHFRRERLTAEWLDQLRPIIEDWGKNDPEPGLHSICQYLSRRWEWRELEQEIAEAESPTVSDTDQVNWQNAPNGHVLATIRGPLEFEMGSPGDEAFRDHNEEIIKRIRIPRTYAIATTEVTVEQFRRFDASFGYAGDYTPSEKCPANMVSWFDAARYCRWLSEQEDLDESEMVFPPLDQIQPGMELPIDYLQRTGYRLPTEAEWEYACRATSPTPRYYGSSDKLLRRYAWTVENSQYRLQPVASLLPNEFGLFDMLGNAMELCLSRHHDGTDISQMGVVTDDGWDDRTAERDVRVTRGSAFLYAPSSTRSASIEPVGSTRQKPYVGFRVVRTIR